MGPTELLTPDTVTIDAVRAVYEQAYLDVTFDAERQFVRIKEDVVARAHLSESKERLQLVAVYGVKDDADRTARLELANRINENFVLVRAGIDDDGDLWFDYCVYFKGGVTPKALVQVTRAFLSIVPKAVAECDEDGIVE